MTELLYATIVFVFGLTFGSFLNVVIYRLPRRLSVVQPRSACPHCGAPIRAYDNIPVASWLLLGGRCRDCRAPISPRYMAVELLTAALFLGCFLQFGLTFALFKYCTFSFLILGLIFIDAEWKLLPDALTLRGIPLGMLFALLVPMDGLLTTVLQDAVRFPGGGDAWRILSLIESAAGAALGAFLIWGAGALYLALRGVEGMGFGDVKLMAMIGAFLGAKLALLTLFLASIAGTLFGVGAMVMVFRRRLRRRRSAPRREPASESRRRAWQSARLVYRHYEMPFGVFLGGMALFSLFAGERLLAWYLGLSA